MAPIVKKQVDDVLGGEEAWKNVAKTDGEYMLWGPCWACARAAPCAISSRHLQCAICFAYTAYLGMRKYVVCTECGSKSCTALTPFFFWPLAATCPKCQYMQAYFMEIQTRSADEPATLFFKCVQCGHRWREG